MDKTVLNQKEKKIVGIQIRTNNKAEVDSLKGKIFPIVKRYFHENLADRISHRIRPKTTYCIYTEYDSDHRGDYTYFIGEEVTSFVNVPQGFVKLTIPAQKYVKFTNGPGSMPDVLRKPWSKIWEMTPEELGGERAYLADFEVYDERASDHQNIILDIYIGVR